MYSSNGRTPLVKVLERITIGTNILCEAVHFKKQYLRESIAHKISGSICSPLCPHTCLLKSVTIHDQSIFVSATQGGFRNVVSSVVSVQFSILSIAVLGRQMEKSLEELIVKHQISRLQSVVSHFQLCTCMDKFARLPEKQTNLSNERSLPMLHCSTSRLMYAYVHFRSE